jgi:hypothetical protein
MHINTLQDRQSADQDIPGRGARSRARASIGGLCSMLSGGTGCPLTPLRSNIATA